MRLPRFLRRRDRTIHVRLYPEMEATTARRETEANWAKVHALTAQHRELRARNHFAASVGKALGGNG